MNRLSPYNIKDPLIRASLYKEWRTGHYGQDEYEVSLDEVAMPELIALRYHSTPRTKLTIAICSELDDLRDEIKPAKVMKLPSNIEIRDRVRYYQKLELRLKEMQVKQKLPLN